ncbi:calymmin [Denticeps clupeoides]|uniref:calymmin n=1 Tax=Denticeps clupeoides TaxID=299321 RepID=UPI0010A3B1E0|nr:spidroin-2-like [Denticeps clupeoides]
MLMPSAGQALGPQSANANLKDKYYGAGAAKGNGAKGNGQGPAGEQTIPGYGSPAANTKGVPAYKGYGSKPNGPGAAAASPAGQAVKGYGAGAQHGQGAKMKGYGASPHYGVHPSNPNTKGYGAAASVPSGPGAKSKGGYGGAGAKPNAPAYASRPAYGSGPGLNKGAGSSQLGARQKGYGYGAQALGGFRPEGYPRPNFGPGTGYPNSAKGLKAGYGGPAGFPNVGAKGPKSGHPNYPSRGAMKGFNQGYGGTPNGQGPKPNVNGGYLSGGAKGPKQGVAGPAGYPTKGNGLPAATAAKGLYNNANVLGYGAKGKGGKGESLGPAAPSIPTVPEYTKGIKTMNKGTPLVPQPTPGAPVPQGKGLKPEVTLGPLGPSGGPAKPATPELLPGILQGNPLKPFQEGPITPQGKAPKPAAPVQPQFNLQGQPLKPGTPDQVLPQMKGPKPGYPSLPSVIPQSKAPKPALVHQGKPQKPEGAGSVPLAQGKPQKPISQGPEARQEVSGPGFSNNQQPLAAKPDCGPGGRPNGQWVNLLNKGYAAAAGGNKGYGANPNGYGKGVGYGSETKGPKAGAGGYPTAPLGLGYGAGYNNGYGAPVQPGYAGAVAERFGEGKSAGAVAGADTTGAGKLPYSGAPIVPAGLDGQSQVPFEPHTANLGANVKSGMHGEMPYGAQPMGQGPEAKSPLKYGIGGLPFGAMPQGPGASGKYGKGNMPYNGKSGGKYGNGGIPYQPQPLAWGPPAKSPSNYGQQYGVPTLGMGSESKSAGKYGEF